MKSRFDWPGVRLLLRAVVVTSLFCLASALPAQDKEPPAKGGRDKAKDKDKPPAAAPEAPDTPATRDKPAAPRGQLYRYKGQKKGTFGGGPAVSLILEDAFTGKTATFFVPNNDPTAKEMDPLTDVASVLEGIEPGTILDVETEKQKGRAVVKSLARAEYKPGEELPNGFVFVESREDRGKSGEVNLFVTLSKFGREVQVGVPMVRDDDVRDAEREPDPKIDRVLRQLQNGDVVEAMVKTGRQPMLVEIYRYEKPERGKFVGIKDVEFNTWPAAGFEIIDAEGVTITFTLEGTEQSRNGQTVYVPNAQHFQAVKRLKPDTEVEVRYRRDGRTWMMRDLKVLALPEKKPKSSKAGKAAPAKSDKGGEEDDEKKMKE